MFSILYPLQRLSIPFFSVHRTTIANSEFHRGQAGHAGCVGDADARTDTARCRGMSWGVASEFPVRGAEVRTLARESASGAENSKTDGERGDSPVLRP